MAITAYASASATQTIDNSGFIAASFTPAVNDLVVVVTICTGDTVAGVTDDQGGSYSQVRSGSGIWVRNTLISSAVATAVTATSNASTDTGFAITVHKVTGLTVAGLAAIRQHASATGSAATTPTVTLPAAPLTGNQMLGAVQNSTNPATQTARASPVWTERFDIGYATPTTGLETMSINSGETSPSIAWGSTSSAWTAWVVEFGTTSPVPFDRLRPLRTLLAR